MRKEGKTVGHDNIERQLLLDVVVTHSFSIFPHRHHSLYTFVFWSFWRSNMRITYAWRYWKICMERTVNLLAIQSTRFLRTLQRSRHSQMLDTYRCSSYQVRYIVPWIILSRKGEDTDFKDLFMYLEQQRHAENIIDLTERQLSTEEDFLKKKNYGWVIHPRNSMALVLSKRYFW